jgi:hypothetical protein
VASRTMMNLFKMSLKVKNREYSGGLIEFSDDVELIVRNCNPVFYTVYELIGVVCGRRCTMTRM